MNRDALPTGEAKARAVQGMFDAIARRYDLVNRVMTFGLDVAWRRRSVEAMALAPGSRVLDLACGTGDFCNELARQGLVPFGLDFSFGMLASATTAAPLAQADALRLPVRDGSADGITCGFALRNVTSIPALFAECARVVRIGGRVAFLETSEPSNPLLRLGYRVYAQGVVPRVGALLSGEGTAYRYLPRSMAYLPPAGELVAMLRAAGFPDAERRTFLGGSAQLLVGTRA